MPDWMTREQRSYCMSRIRGSNTSIELLLKHALAKQGLRFKRNDHTIPGRPDFAFKAARVLVFADGDFWHGYRYPQWRERLSAFWKAKIERNRIRDHRIHRRLRRAGWRVIRVWEHDIRNDLTAVTARIVAVVRGHSE